MSDSVAIVDYGSGNLRSAAKAFERAARDLSLSVIVTSEPELVAAARWIVLPGVGAFADCRRGLAAVDGLEAALREAVIARARPFLGICVGMQLMARRGLEHGVHEGLGWIDGEVAALRPQDPGLKIPHMGWNDLAFPAGPRHPVFAGIAQGRHVYFVHGFAFQSITPEQVLAEVDYGGPLVAAVGRDNLVGTQFHPEKSQAVGLRLIAGFLAWKP